jgi:hypothetical protein
VKKGYIFFSPPEPINVTQDDGSLKEYTFGPKKKTHVVCIRFLFVLYFNIIGPVLAGTLDATD